MNYTIKKKKAHAQSPLKVSWLVDVWGMFARVYWHDDVMADLTEVF